MVFMDKEKILEFIIEIKVVDGVWTDKALSYGKYMTEEEMMEWTKRLIKIADMNDINYNGEIINYQITEDIFELMTKLEKKICNELKMRLCGE